MELSDATMRSKSSHLMKIKWKKRCENPLHCYCIFTNMRIFCTNNKFQREQQIQPTRSFARDNYEILLSIRLMQLLYMKWCHFDESPTQRDGVSHSYHPQLSVALDTLIVVVVLFISHVYVYRCIQSNVIKKEIVWYCILIRQLNKIPCLYDDIATNSLSLSFSFIFPNDDYVSQITAHKWIVSNTSTKLIGMNDDKK